MGMSQHLPLTESDMPFSIEHKAYITTVQLNHKHLSLIFTSSASTTVILVFGRQQATHKIARKDILYVCEHLANLPTAVQHICS